MPGVSASFGSESHSKEFAQSRFQNFVLSWCGMIGGTGAVYSFGILVIRRPGSRTDCCLSSIASSGIRISAVDI